MWIGAFPLYVWLEIFEFCEHGALRCRETCKAMTQLYREHGARIYTAMLARLWLDTARSDAHTPLQRLRAVVCFRMRNGAQLFGQALWRRRGVDRISVSADNVISGARVADGLFAERVATSVALARHDALCFEVEILSLCAHKHCTVGLSGVQRAVRSIVGCECEDVALSCASGLVMTGGRLQARAGCPATLQSPCSMAVSQTLCVVLWRETVHFAALHADGTTVWRAQHALPAGVERLSAAVSVCCAADRVRVRTRAFEPALRRLGLLR